MLTILTICLLIFHLLIAFAAPVISEEHDETPAPLHECSGKRDGDLVGDNKDRSVFYECLSSGYAYRFHCPAGLIFSSSLKRCDYDPDHPVTHPAEQQNSKFDCHRKPDGFYADRNSPKKFHRCYNGLAADFECPSGTLFQESRQVCVYDADWDKEKTSGTTEEYTTRHHRHDPTTTEEHTTRHHRHETTTEETFPTEAWTTPKPASTTEFINPFDPDPKVTRGHHCHHHGDGN